MATTTAFTCGSIPATPLIRRHTTHSPPHHSFAATPLAATPLTSDVHHDFGTTISGHRNFRVVDHHNPHPWNGQSRGHCSCEAVTEMQRKDLQWRKTKKCSSFARC